MSVTDLPCVINWSIDDVLFWLEKKKYLLEIRRLFEIQRIDGRALLLLNEQDVKFMLSNQVMHMHLFIF